MALIICPECRKEISDKSKQCIYCGYPLDIDNLHRDTADQLFMIKLNSIIGQNNAKMAKKIMCITNLNVSEAAYLVKNTPSIIINGLSYEKCKEIQEIFNAYGAVKEIVEDNKSKTRNTSLDNYNISDLKKDIRVQSQVRCPFCNTTNVKKISGTSKAISILGFGILSNKIGKQWHCNDCGSDF